MRIWPALVIGLASAPALAQRTEEGLAIEEHFNEWRFTEGRAGLAAMAAGRRADSAERHFLDGYARFLDGRYGEAAKSLEAAAGLLAPDADESERGEIKMMRDLALGAAEAVQGHKEARSAHFIVRYPPADEAMVSYALETLEAAAGLLARELGFSPTEPVRVEVYASASELASVSLLSIAEIERTGTIALCKWSRVMLTSPRALAHGYPWLDTLTHEFVHYAVSSLTRDRAPVWLQEGLAKYLERRWRGGDPPPPTLTPTMEGELARALAGGKLVTFDEMHPSMAKLKDAATAALAFAEVAVLVEHLTKEGGPPLLRAVLDLVARGTDAREAVARATGKTWPAFESGWRAYMVAQRYRHLPGVRAETAKPKLRRGKAPSGAPSEDEGLGGELRTADAFKLVRLGNMMLLHGRPRAAAAEYDKARKRDGTDHPAIAVKLGRTQLALGEADRALDAVKGARALYPDLPGPHLIAGRALLARGEAAAAVAALDASLAINPFDPEVHCGLAEAYDKLADAARPPAERRDRERRLCQELGAR